MKKYFGITLVVMLLMVLCAVPSFAEEHDIIEELTEEFYTHDIVLDGVIIMGDYNDGKYTRWDEIKHDAFRNAEGITSVNLSSGNGNVLETNVDISALAEASSLDLTGSMIFITGSYMDKPCKSYMRWDTISNNAFRDVVGITSVNMSSGNGNVLQTNLGIEVTPAVY